MGGIAAVEFSVVSFQNVVPEMGHTLGTVRTQQATLRRHDNCDWPVREISRRHHRIDLSYVRDDSPYPIMPDSQSGLSPLSLPKDHGLFFFDSW